MTKLYRNKQARLLSQSIHGPSWKPYKPPVDDTAEPPKFKYPTYHAKKKIVHNKEI